MKQNEDYSITIKAGKKPNSEESNFDILTTAIRGFDWTYEGSSRSWTISTEKLISISDIDPNNETVTIKYDPTDEGGLIGLYSYIYNYEHDIPTMTFIAENYAPGIIYSIDVPTSRNIHFKNPIRDVPTDLVAYILGTKVMITTSDRLYLAGLNSIEFQQDRNGKVRGDWVMRKKDWDFSDLKYNTQSQKYELSIPVTFNDLDKFTPFPLVEFMLLTRNAAYRDVQGGPKENFKASAFLENTQNALDNNLDPEKLADLDDDTKTDFKHVDIEGTVTSNDNVVDINGSIAGAVTEEDTDLHDNEKINISTTITEGIEAADEQDIMNYLNGHHLGEVKHAVGITVVKTYEGQEPQVVKEIGVNSAIVFDNMPALEPGREYIIVTKHNGKIKTIPVTYKNGKVIGYTNEFSSFVLTTQDVPTPSKKESSNNSSSSTKKTDNVVTCQMAGYPANYAWNEAAKACQPGYLDANGVFRSTAKAGVPNTYDKGLMGNVISLVTASVIAMIAAHLLKNG